MEKTDWRYLSLALSRTDECASVTLGLVTCCPASSGQPISAEGSQRYCTYDAKRPRRLGLRSFPFRLPAGLEEAGVGLVLDKVRRDVGAQTHIHETSLQLLPGTMTVRLGLPVGDEGPLVVPGPGDRVRRPAELDWRCPSSCPSPGRRTIP